MKKFVLLAVVVVFTAGFFGCSDGPTEPATVDITIYNETTDVYACVKQDGGVIAVIDPGSNHTVTINEDSCLVYEGFYSGGNCSDPSGNWFDAEEQCYSKDKSVYLTD